MDPMSETPEIVEFGRFRILPHRRELLADGQPIRIGGRAFDVLMALIEARGAVVSKDALISRVWPNRNVEQNAIQAQISALRDVFGADRDLIRTLRGRGYLFTGDVRALLAGPRDQPITDPTSTDPASARPKTNLAEPVSKLVGRDVDLAEIASLSTAHRLLTLTGAGGIGKTRLRPGGRWPFATAICRRGLDCRTRTSLRPPPRPGHRRQSGRARAPWRRDFSRMCGQRIGEKPDPTRSG